MRALGPDPRRTCDNLALDADGAGRDHAERMRIEAVLGGEHACADTVLGIAREHANGGLGHDWTAIHLRAHEMHGAAAELDARFQNARMSIEAAKGGEERRVDVEMPVPPMLDEAL